MEGRINQNQEDVNMWFDNIFRPGYQLLDHPTKIPLYYILFILGTTIYHWFMDICNVEYSTEY